MGQTQLVSSWVQAWQSRIKRKVGMVTFIIYHGIKNKVKNPNG
jgi:hypothetical protein